MFCQYCGSKLTDDARFCSQCGKPVPQDSDLAETQTTDDGHRKSVAVASQGTASGESLSLSCVYKAPGFLIADLIPGDLTLTDTTLAFKQWKIRVLQTVITLGALSYSTGEGIEWPLHDIRSATLKEGWRNATLSICSRDGKVVDFIITKSGKLDRFMELLLAKSRASENANGCR